MNKKPGLRDKVRYLFENSLSKGTIAMIGWLALLSLLIVVLAGIILTVAGISQNPEEKLSFYEAAWQSLMHALDAGALGADAGWHFRFVMFFVTIGGIFILSSLIGTLTSGLQSKIEEMRKGKSRVIESGHTVILGWNGKIFPIISELIIANESLKDASIAILAERDKVEMEDELNSKIQDRKSTRIICRTGSPMDINDLEVMNINEAKSIIIIAPEDNDPDIFVIKTVLAITNNPNRKQEDYHIVADIKKEENLPAANLVSNDEATYILSTDLIARVTAQTCRQSGLSVVYTELLDFQGVEIYFKEEVTLVGKKFSEVLHFFDTCAVIGIAKGEEVLINPPMSTKISEKDEIILIAEDDSKIQVTGLVKPEIKKNLFLSQKTQGLKKEKTLNLGWNEKGTTIIRELENYVGKNSELLIVSELEETVSEVNSVKKLLKQQKVKTMTANITDRKVLDSINVASYDHIIILCYSGKMEVQDADAKTLICLLHLRDISNKSNTPLNIVSEMLDSKNRALAEVAKADDFIISDRLVSLMLSQLSETKQLIKVFNILFSVEGAEIYLKPVSEFVKPGPLMDFYTVIESAAEKSQVAIGYRIHSQANDADKAYGVIINPKKSDTVTFEPEDKIIVIAND